MTRVTLLLIALALGLAACDPPHKDAAQPAPARAVPHAKKCPDPDNRDRKDPCSVSYLKRTPAKASADALK